MKKDYSKFGLHIPEIMVPAEGTDYYRWAVVACDQYTSEPDYWDEVEGIVGDAPSALRMMLPEIYLGGPDEARRIESIRVAMDKYISDGALRVMPPGCMFIRRKVAGRTRLGLVIATDLEAYDYSAGSTSQTRATEGTVIERIPPRLRIREGAPLEMPHIIILIDDPGHTVIEPLADVPQELIYDTDLMMDGGHITGSYIKEENLVGMHSALEKLYRDAESRYGTGNVIFQAVGDGNHSLATARANWEIIKKDLSPSEMDHHPARYALCEIENIHDPGIVFEPIHRVLFAKGDLGGDDLVREVAAMLESKNGPVHIVTCDAYESVATSDHDGALHIPYITSDSRGEMIIDHPATDLASEVLQNALDAIVTEKRYADTDYIHGVNSVESLANIPGNAGFILPAMDKADLFTAIAVGGALPRKTFSMGEANEKRYYIECRKI